MSFPAIWQDWSGRRTLGLQIGGSWPGGCPDQETTLRVAKRAEALGFDALWAGDHVIAHSPIVDSLLLLASLAAVTENIAVGTSVYLIGLRPPVLTSKSVSSLDFLAKGRFLFGVGVGGEMPDEWEACAVPRAHRGLRVDNALTEIVGIWSAAWGNNQEGPEVFRRIQPTTMRPEGPPILVGGRSDAALKRASRYDGWIGYMLTPERFSECRTLVLDNRTRAGQPIFAHVLFVSIGEGKLARATALRCLAERYQRSFEHNLENYCLVGPAEVCRRRMEEYQNAGVDHIILAPLCEGGQLEPQVDLLAEALM